MIDGVIRATVMQIQQEGKPVFYHGNPTSISNTVVREKRVARKYPLVILMDDIKEQVVRSNLSQVESTFFVQMFFMDRVNTGWNSIEQMDYVIRPMREMLEAFLVRLEKQPRVHSLENVETEMKMNWGLKVETDGKRSSVFPDWLSGIELRAEINVFRAVKCK